MDAAENHQIESEEFERWTCDRHDPPILLAMVDAAGHLHIKVRNRDWYVTDFTTVTATCPKCGAVHTRKFAGR
ncbi:MAG: hypothetical protein KC435_07210 [Thermomicrobiales bacterium]|nr:hypothetical protein [Thermomicrobiales bacterium]